MNKITKKIPKGQKKGGTSFFKQLTDRKREVKQHLSEGGSLTELQGKNHSFVQPV